MNVKAYKIIKNPKNKNELVSSGGTTVIETGWTVALEEELYLDFVKDFQGEWEFLEGGDYILVMSQSGNYPKIVVNPQGTTSAKMVGIVVEE